MTREELIDVIKEFFDIQLNCGYIADAPKAVDVADYIIGRGVKVAPLKVGDKVYIPELMDNAVYEYTVSSVDEMDECFTAFCDELDDTYRTTFGSIGTHVYLSREEAELYLKTNRKKDLRALLKYYISEEEWREASEIIDILRRDAI